MIFLIDHNLKGHALVFFGAIATQGWLDIVPIQFVTFAEMDLSIDSDDRTVWRLAQENQMILLTANRSMKGKDSLEQVMREENTSESLPVITVSNTDRGTDQLKRDCYNAFALTDQCLNDVAWGLFFKWLSYFGVKYGRQIVAVNPYNTSQMCSNCGTIVPKTLEVRTHICGCGLVLDRDTNAALNILKLATEGHSECQAYGVGTATLLGENLVEQVLTLR
jgi:hypothetical protein